MIMDRLLNVKTHRDAWRGALEKLKTQTDDDNGSGYYSHEIKAFDETFETFDSLVEWFTGSMTQLYPIYTTKGMKILSDAIESALKCTPSVSTGNDGFDEPHIIYDCGNPWEILQNALKEIKEESHSTDPGGQDRKYKFENGQFVNRISGEPIPKDEPTFILRARDFHSLAVLKDYLYLIHDDHHKKAVQDRIDEFEKFAMDNPVRMKEPGITGDIELNEEREEDVPITSQLPTP
jgi:hypothetical protein